MTIIDIVYHAESKLMELKGHSSDMPIGTDGDDYATYLHFIIDDADGILDNVGIRLEFDVLIRGESYDDESYKPYVFLDDTMMVPLTKKLLKNVKYGAIPLQLAFTGVNGNGQPYEFYSLNKLLLKLSDSIQALEGFEYEERIDYLSLLNDVDFDPSTSTFTFGQLDGREIQFQITTRIEQHYTIKDVSELTSLTTARTGDTAMTQDRQWFILYGSYENESDWKTLSMPTDVIDAHISDRNNPHAVTKAQIGLDAVDNTSDLDKPVSTATQIEIDRVSEAISTETSERTAKLIEISDIIRVLSQTTQTGLDEKVSKSGDTMTGNLTIQRASTPSIGVRATEGNYGDVLFYDSGSNRSAFVRGEHTSDYNRLVLGCSNPNGNTIHYTMQLYNHATDGAYILAPTPSDKADNSTKIATTEWTNQASSLVHSTGNETINGRKTFGTPLSISNAGNFNWSNPSNIRGEKGGNEQNFNFTDANGTPTARIHHYVNSNNLRSVLYLETYNKKSDDTTVSASIIAVANTDGSSYALAPTTPSSATSNEVATANWSIGKFVQKSGDTMTGNLTLSMGYPVVYVKNTNTPNKSAPTETKYGGFVFRDSGDTERGGVQVCATPTGGAILMTTRTNDASSIAYLRLYAKDDGTKYADAPSWSVGTNDNSDKILTIKMANSLPSLVHTTGNETVSGVKTLTSSPIVKFANETSVTLQRANVDNDNTYFTYGRFIIRNDTEDKGVISAGGTSTRTRVVLTNKLKGKNSEIAIEQYSDGRTWATAPPTPIDANSNEIATAGWVNTKISSISNIYRPCGSVPTFSDLPNTANIGDVYYVESDAQNYVWIDVNGTAQWKPLGSTIDMTQYYDKTEVDSKVSEVRTIADGKLSKSGDTMTGGLVINTTYPRLDLVRNDYVHGTAPTSDKIWALARVLDNGTTKRTLMTNELKVNTSETFSYSTSVYDSNNKWHYPFVIKWAKDYSTVEVTAPTPSDKADNSTKIATTAWVNSADSVVHKTGNETVAGTKTFSNAPLVKGGRIRCINPNLPSQSAPTSYQYEQGIIFQDVAYKEVGAVFHQVAKNSTTGETHITSISNGANRKEVRLSVFSPDGGGGYATAPTTPSNATSNEIATADWSIGKFVQKSGDTMTGSLTIAGTGYNSLNLKSPDGEVATTQTANDMAIRFRDKNDTAMGGIYSNISSAHVTYIDLRAITKKADGSLFQPSITLRAYPDGTSRATAPTPPDSSDNSVRIATTEWVNSADSVVHTTGNETVAGEKTFTSPITIAMSGKKTSFVMHNTTDLSSTSNTHNDFIFRQNGTNRLYARYNATSEAHNLEFRVNNASGSGGTVGLKLGWNSTKGVYVEAITTPTDATSNEIATADWVNTKLATRVQKLTLNGTITDGLIVTTDIQANDTVFVSINTAGVIGPITFTVDIPSTVENATLVKSSSHITDKSDGKLYSIDIYAQLRNTKWYIGIVQRGITGGAVSNPAVTSFTGHILRAG